MMSSCFVIEKNIIKFKENYTIFYIDFFLLKRDLIFLVN